jgi:hypothetical protein
MSSVQHAKLHLNKRSLKLSGQTYSVQQKKLERVLAAQLEELELKEKAIAADRTREQVRAEHVHQRSTSGKQMRRTNIKLRLSTGTCRPRCSPRTGDRLA